MNDTLIDQYCCGESADSEFLIWKSSDPDNAIAAVFPDEFNKSRGDLAERIVRLLNAERSKRPPMISVEDAMAAVKEWTEWAYDDDLDEQPTLRAGLRARLTAAATNNTNDNGQA